MLGVSPDYGAHYVNTVLRTLWANPELWKSTAVFTTYDEHDGFFDHQLPPFAETTVTDEYIPSDIPSLDKTWALSQETGGSTATPAAVYTDDYVTATCTPFTVLKSEPRSYTWDSTLTAGKYAFSIYGPDGFLTSFAGTVVAAAVTDTPVAAVNAAIRGRLELTLKNEGSGDIVYTLTPNDYEGRTETVKVTKHTPRTLAWPTNEDGYYDVVISANTGDGFRRRFAGRLA